MFYPFFFFFQHEQRVSQIYRLFFMPQRLDSAPYRQRCVHPHPSRPGSSVQGEGAAAAAGLGNTTPGLLLVKNRPPAAFIASPALTCGNI